MADLIVKDLSTYSEQEVCEVNLSMRLQDFLDFLVSEGGLSPISNEDKSNGMGYRIVKDGKLINVEKNFLDAGFKDGDTIEVVKKAVGA